MLTKPKTIHLLHVIAQNHDCTSSVVGVAIGITGASGMLSVLCRENALHCTISAIDHMINYSVNEGDRGSDITWKWHYYTEMCSMKDEALRPHVILAQM